jgi:hypothetical protein
MLTVKLDPLIKSLKMLSIDDNGLIIKDETKFVFPKGMRIWRINYLQSLHSSPEKVIKEPKNLSVGRLSLWM